MFERAASAHQNRVVGRADLLSKFAPRRVFVGLERIKIEPFINHFDFFGRDVVIVDEFIAHGIRRREEFVAVLF